MNYLNVENIARSGDGVEYHPLVPFLPSNAKVLFLGSFPPQRKRWCMDFFYPNFINDHLQRKGDSLLRYGLCCAPFEGECFGQVSGGGGTDGHQCPAASAARVQSRCDDGRKGYRHALPVLRGGE